MPSGVLWHRTHEAAVQCRAAGTVHSPTPPLLPEDWNDLPLLQAETQPNPNRVCPPETHSQKGIHRPNPNPWVPLDSTEAKQGVRQSVLQDNPELNGGWCKQSPGGPDTPHPHPLPTPHPPTPFRPPTCPQPPCPPPPPCQIYGSCTSPGAGPACAVAGRLICPPAKPGCSAALGTWHPR